MAFLLWSALASGNGRAITTPLVLISAINLVVNYLTVGGGAAVSKGPLIPVRRNSSTVITR